MIAQESITKCSNPFFNSMQGLIWDTEGSITTHAINGAYTLCGKPIRGRNKGWLRGLKDTVDCKQCLKILSKQKAG